MTAAAPQGLLFISAPHEGGNKNPFLMLMDKAEEEEKRMMMLMMINKHNDRCKQ